MHRFTLSCLAALLLIAPSYAQEADTEDPDTTETEAAEAEELAEDPVLDEQGYSEQNEDDFDPTEDVAADQALTFPTDI